MMAWRNGKIENSHDLLLFEASGDSEVAAEEDSNSNNIGDHTELANSNNIVGDTEGYDAESCSCEYYYPASDDHLLDFDHHDEFNDDDKVQLSDRSNRSSTDQEDDSKPRLTAAAMEGEPEEEEEEVESRFCVNGRSTVDILIRDDIDEMERNRLFWKTCLQVGYP